MRVLFTLLPATGSLHPLLPIARALVQAGHEVAFCSSHSFRPDLEAHGFTAFPAGLDFLISDPRYIDILCQEAGLTLPALAGKDRFAWVVNELFIGVAARRMLPDVVALARDWAADLIVRESLEFSGCVAAERLDLPHAAVAAAADSALDLRAQLREPLAKLRAQAGLPPDSDMQMPYRFMHLCFMPPTWDGPDATFPEAAHFLRHTNPPRPGDSVPLWPGRLSAAPLVMVSLGTVFHRTSGLLEQILEGLGGEPISLLVGVGQDRDPARFGPQPTSVRIERYLPLPQVLPNCALLLAATLCPLPSALLVLAQFQHRRRRGRSSGLQFSAGGDFEMATGGDHHGPSAGTDVGHQWIL